MGLASLKGSDQAISRRNQPQGMGFRQPTGGAVPIQALARPRFSAYGSDRLHPAGLKAPHGV
jgi:hypothetical protein